MKQIVVFSLLVLFSLSVHAQDFQRLPEIPMTTEAEYDTNEPLAFELTEYLLLHELDFEESNRMLAVQFLMRWMEGTPIAFELGQDFLTYSDGDLDRTQIFLAALVHAALEDAEATPDTDAMNERAVVLFLEYCRDHDIKKNKAIKKALKAMPEE